MRLSASATERFRERSGLTASSSLAEVVEAIRVIPYGRPSVRDAEHVVLEWRGTCSTKHALLHAIIAEHWPQLQPRIVHRVYRVTRASAAPQLGEQAAVLVPPDGLLDVHRFLEVTIGAGVVRLDVTFPGEPWDGATDMPLACGAGVDHLAGDDPDRDKRQLEASCCDATVREPFIVALSQRDPVARSTGARRRWGR